MACFCMNIEAKNQSVWYDKFNMRKLDQSGSLVLPLIMTVVLLFGALGFGFWAFSERQTYKTDVDKQIEAAVAETKEIVAQEKEGEFAERDKSPFKTYQGPSALGTLGVTYPRTWSAYISEDIGAVIELDGYIHPNFVPSTKGNTSFALRFEVVNQTYDAVIRVYESKVKTGKLTATAYRAPKVSQELGVQLTGEIDTQKQGIIVLLPTRDKTIKIWTEGQDFAGDYKTIMDNFTYVP